MKQVLVQANLTIDGYLLGHQRAAGGQSEWVSVETAAKALDVSGRHIRNLCKSGKLHHRRVGKLYKIHVTELSLTRSSPRRDPTPKPASELMPVSTASSADSSKAEMPQRYLLARSPEEAAFYHLTRTKTYNRVTGKFEPKKRPLRHIPIYIKDPRTKELKLWTPS